jgi:prepilin-type N-terminal cleavage/methylation domain-containing protein
LAGSWGRRRDNQGFTLLELMAVLAVLAILAAMTVPKYTKIVAKSKIDICKNNIQMLNHASEIYLEVEGTWPTSQKDLKDKGYIDQVAVCPVTKMEYGSPTSGVFSCPHGQ